MNTYFCILGIILSVYSVIISILYINKKPIIKYVYKNSLEYKILLKYLEYKYNICIENIFLKTNENYIKHYCINNKNLFAENNEISKLDFIAINVETIIFTIDDKKYSCRFALCEKCNKLFFINNSIIKLKDKDDSNG
jgi:hypothetical protein